MWDSLAPWLAQGGVTGVILWAAITLVRIAVAAERGRADDHKEAARTTAEAQAVTVAQVEKLVTAVEQLTAAQRETLDLVRRLVSAERGAA